MMRSRSPCCRRRSSSQAQCLASFHKLALPVGPPIEHKVARETFLKDAAAAGLALASEHGFLPYQNFVVLTPQRR
jgi:hypothetical protein